MPNGHPISSTMYNRGDLHGVIYNNNIEFDDVLLSNITATSTVFANLNVSTNINSNTSSSSFLLGNATVSKLLNSTVSANSNITSDVKLSYNLSSSLTGTGTTAADVTVTTPASLLLDLYPNAAAAYSLRKLRAAYTGSAIRVRRSSDNTEQDIGFVNDNLDASSLTTFCGAGNGFVTIWYDQSGNAQNATMTTQANQPQIVSSGTIITHNNKYALQYDGTNDSLNATISGMQNTTALCVFYVYSTNLAAAADTNTAALWVNGTFSSTNLRAHFSSTGLLTGEYMIFDCRKSSYGVERIGSSTYRRSANSIVTENTFYLTTGTSFQQNNNLISLDLLTQGVTTSENLTPNLYNTDNNLIIGFSGSVYANEKISEFIVYLSNETNNRSNINTNINTHYAIY